MLLYSIIILHLFNIFRFFCTQQNWWVSSSICRLTFDKLLKCPAFYQFLGANKNFVSNKLREFNSVDGLLSLSDKHKSI